MTIQLLNKLVGSWSLNGNSNDALNLNNGIDTAITYTNGKQGNGANFNGASSKIQISTVAGSPFRQAAGITYEMWLNIPAAGTGRIGVATTGGNGSGGMTLTNASLAFSWTPTTPNADRAWTAAVALAAGTYNHIVFAITFTGVPTAVFYVNGVAQATNINVADVTNGVPRTSYNVANGDCIGARYVNAFAYGNASFSRLNVFNAALSASEVLYMYNNGSAMPYPFNKNQSFHRYF